MNRAKNQEVFDKIVKLINDFKGYYLRHGQPIFENPSPWDIAGGITTLEDKSLGCMQKSGNSDISGVLFDGDAATERGLNLLSGLGNDSCLHGRFLRWVGARRSAILFRPSRYRPTRSWYAKRTVRATLTRGRLPAGRALKAPWSGLLSLL